ncbi:MULTISPECIES: hypothetical protein [Bacillus]|uniref:hypothetical protein n=1 Tax=Bacillus TaxID=1386 RepID=UPI000671AFC9|nr:hypothetical protein [Bacillus licheniformis]AKQ71796.1 hypothetical protein MUY_000664 [Bacillus licheniformis WX-02]MCP8974465.1 hypothetical protein [Bacillus licheniformis]
MGKRQRKSIKIKNTSQPKVSVKSQTPNTKVGDTLTFDLSYENWMNGIQIKGFTNKLRDIEQHSQYTYEIFNKIIPNVHKNWKIIKRQKGQGQFRHCHILEGEEKEKAIKIAEAIHKKTILDEETDFNIWQFGLTNSIRIVAVYDHNNDIAYPIFLDYHHLIYPNVKYNQSDYAKYDFCPHLEHGIKF